MTELDCYKSTCDGTLEARGESGVLFECSDCGGSVAEAPIRELSQDSGPVAQLAEVLMEKA